MSKTLNIALFGDLHGRLLLPFYLGKRWEEEHGEELHYALSVGDAGIYRSIHAMDKASRRWAERYPEELGFAKYFMAIEDGRIVRNAVAAQVLEAGGFDLLFVPGNHEEHGYLQRIWDQFARSATAPVAVDMDWEGIGARKYDDEFAGSGRIKMLPQGQTVVLDGPVGPETDWEPAFHATLMALNGLDRYTPGPAWSATDTEVDILVTHETFAGRFVGGDYPERLETAGSKRLLDFIRRTGPRWHFSGHHHRFCPEAVVNNDQGGVTRSIGLNQVMFKDKGQPISQGCFGILRIDASGGASFEKMKDDWFQRLMFSQCSWLL